MKDRKKFLIIASRCRGLGARRLADSLCEELDDSDDFVILKPEANLWTNFMKYTLFYLNNQKSRRVVWCLNDLPFYTFKIDYLLFHNTLLIGQSETVLLILKRFLLMTFLKWKRLSVVCQTTLTAEEFKTFFGQLNLKVDVKMHPLPQTQKAIQKSENLEYKLHKKKTHILYPVANYPHKNILFLLKNLQIFREENLTLVLCSDPFEGYDDDDAVIFLGRVSMTSMNALYQSVDAVINVSDTESVGLSLLETVKFRKPLISIDKNYVSTVVTDFYRIKNLTPKDLRAGIRSAKIDNFKTVPRTNLRMSKTWREYFSGHKL